ncbi:MAG: hypothetical protein AAB403_16145 [Planctomycetota bacterium]
MSKGPKGERRPADLNKRAFAIVQIASGEITEALPKKLQHQVDLSARDVR